MKLLKEFVPYTVTSKPCAFLFGNFDGVHLGHQFIFQKVINLAKEHNLQSVILTFQNHPAEILRPHSVPKRLIAAQKKIAMIESFGFDVVIDLAFTNSLANLTADDFFLKLQAMLPFHYFVAGIDVAFGKDRKGNKDYLLAKAKEIDFKLLFLEKFTVDGITVSSSAIRTLIQEAKFYEAERLLGRPYKLICKVISTEPKLIVDADGFALPLSGKYQAILRKEEADESLSYKAEVQILANDLLEITITDKVSLGACKYIEVQFESSSCIKKIAHRV